MSPASDRPAAVIFDCDGVLVNSEEIALEVELAVLADAGLIYDRHEYMARFMGRSVATWWQELEVDSTKRFGRSNLDEVRGPMRDRMRAEIRSRLAEIPGAASAVSSVRLPRAVASSSDAAALRLKLRAVGHWDLFAPHVYSADDVATPKPAPDLFMAAAARLGVEAEKCLVIEDSVNGVSAGRAAGMRVWGFVGGRHHSAESSARLREAGAERLVVDWAEGADLLAGL